MTIEHVIIAEHRTSIGLSFKHDLSSAEKLDQLLATRATDLPVVRLQDIVERLAKARNVLVLMPGPGLARLSNIVRILSDCARGLVIVDSAVDYLHRHSDILQYLKDTVDFSILVTDLDSSPTAFRDVSRVLDPVIVVHAHGGNEDRLDIVLELENTVCGTCQVDVPYLRYVSYCPGFTDGDRALYMTHLAGCRALVLGWNPDVEQCLASKPITRIKKLKLSMAKEILQELRWLGGFFLFF